MSKVSAVILCYNEEPNIRHCLESVKGWCDILVVDSGSTDRTVDICQEYTEKIFVHDYSSHAAQWQWALDTLPIRSEWILVLDSDFVVTSDLKHQILNDLPQVAPDVNGIYVGHKYVFGGGLIRFGGTKQFWLRLVRRGRVSADVSDLVDFRFVVQGKTSRFSGAVAPDGRIARVTGIWG